jgi:hypothetical protein
MHPELVLPHSASNLCSTFSTFVTSAGFRMVVGTEGIPGLLVFEGVFKSAVLIWKPYS